MIASPDRFSSFMMRARSELPCAATRRDIVAAAPDVHLLLAPALAGIILVEAGEIAVIALVQSLVADGLQLLLAEHVQNDAERVLGSLERARKGDVEAQALCFQQLCAAARFGHSLFREVRVLPAGE
jgi:hypothetical protein